MFEASRCCAGGYEKGGRGSTVLNRLYVFSARSYAIAQANGNNVIVLINRDTAGGRKHGISARVLLKALILSLTISDNDL